MNTVEVLIEGYAKVTDTGWDASGTTCLITTDSGLKIITDPGANRDLLLQKLQEKGLTVEDIPFVFLTHHHLDHALNAGLFTKSQVIDNEAIYTQAKAVEGVTEISGTDITVVQTPGHEYGHAVLVLPTNEGTVVIAGDNFWWKEGEEQIIDINKHDDFAGSMEELTKSRKKVLELADWIIPGHGKKQKINK